MFAIEGPALLAALAADNTREFWDGHRDRYETQLRAPICALAAALEPEFGPVRVFRPQVNRRFRPDAPLYRTDVGAVAAGGVLGVVLTATALSVSAGHWAFDGPQLRRYRAAVDDELAAIVEALEGWALDGTRLLATRPRGVAADHPHLGLLRHRGLQVRRSWEVGPWLATGEPLHRVRAAWRAAGPLLAWLDVHVGAADPVAPRPRGLTPPDDRPGGPARETESSPASSLGVVAP